MPARFLYMGLHAAFTRNGGSPVNITTSASAYNSTYTDSYLSLDNTPTAFAIADFTDGSGANDWCAAGETLWVRQDIWYSGGTLNGNPMILLNDADQQVVRLRITASGVVQLQYNTGTLATPVWTQLGTNITHTASTRRTYVLRLYIDPAGTAHTYELFVDGTSTLSGSFSSALLTRIDAIRAGDGNTHMGLSQLLVAVDRSLVGSFCASIRASGAGSNSAMTGAFTDVNEIALSDATIVSSNTNGQRTTFAMGDLPALSGLVVANEQRHVFRANNDGGTGPQNIKPVVRNSGVDTVGANVSGLALGYKPISVPYSLTFSQINAAGFELGWESAA